MLIDRSHKRLALVLAAAASVAMAASLGTTASATAAARTHAAAAVPADWSSYLFASDHSGFNPSATAITASNATSLVKVWHWKPAAPTQLHQAGGLYSSPVVFGGTVYIGARTGVFYALNEATGAQLWSRDFGFVLRTTCPPSEGFTSTATVAPDPKTGTPVVYVAAPDGYLYALNAADGSTLWRAVVGIPSTTVNDYYNWASPTVSNGVVYMGIASNCDVPLVRGGVVSVDQATGAPLGTYYSIKAGHVGASVWGSVLATPAGNIFAATGNGQPVSDQASVVRLVSSATAGTLTRVDKWTVPKTQQSIDSDFGTSPTSFVATLNGVVTPMVGACNKDGIYYAFQESNLAAGPVWSIRLGNPFIGGTDECDASAIWDGSHLYVASNSTLVGGVAQPGALREVDPATGAIIWETALPGALVGSPTLDGGGVIAASIFGGANSGPYLIDASSGTILKVVSPTNGMSFAQSIWTDSGLLLATGLTNGVTAYRAP